MPNTALARKFAAALDAESTRPELAAWNTVLTAGAMTIRHLADAIDAHLAKAGPVGDGLPDENWFADQLCDLRNRWGEHEPSWLETDDNHPDYWMAKELRKRLLALPASPTPDKEGQP
jgi:hypothetical protein